MNCIDFCVIFKYCVKQLMIFGRTVVAAFDLKNCTMVNCDSSEFEEIFKVTAQESEPFVLSCVTYMIYVLPV